MKGINMCCWTVCPVHLVDSLDRLPTTHVNNSHPTGLEPKARLRLLGGPPAYLALHAPAAPLDGSTLHIEEGRL